MKKIIFTSVAAIGLFTSIVLFANTQSAKQPETCRCKLFGNKACSASGWGKKCAITNADNCSMFDKNCDRPTLTEAN